MSECDGVSEVSVTDSGSNSVDSGKMKIMETASVSEEQ